MKWFNKWLNPGQMELAGLDIGAGSVKLVALQNHDRRWTITSAAHAAVEPAENPSLYEENTLNAIRQCFQIAGPAAPRSVVCGISGQAVSVRGFRFPPIPDNAIEQAIKLEAQQTCALDIANSVIDYQLLAEQSGSSEDAQKQGRKGYFVAGLQDAINRKIRLAQLAQTKTVLMDLDSLAILNCISLLPENQSTESIAAMDIGHSSATMAILGSDGAPFVRTLSGSGQQVIAAISTKTGASAAEIKKKLLSDAVPEGSPLETELHSATAKMITDAVETLRFYSMQPNSPKVSRLYLCGGFSLYKSFVRLMQQRLSVACSVFDPLKVLHSPDSSEIHTVFNQFGPAMTVAAGLAMRSINHVHN